MQHSCKKIKLIIVYHQDNRYLQLVVLKLDSNNESGFFFRIILVGFELYLINYKVFADKINIRCRKNLVIRMIIRIFVVTLQME